MRRFISFFSCFSKVKQNTEVDLRHHKKLAVYFYFFASLCQKSWQSDKILGDGQKSGLKSDWQAEYLNIHISY